MSTDRFNAQTPVLGNANPGGKFAPACLLRISKAKITLIFGEIKTDILLWKNWI